MSSYPIVDPPELQPDGTYIVRVHKGPAAVEELPAKKHKQALELYAVAQRFRQVFTPVEPPQPIDDPRGRKPLLTEQRRRIIVRCFGKMMPLKNIAASASVSERTLFRWLENGERAAATLEDAPEDYEEPERDALYRQLWQACKKAEADLIEKLCEKVIAHGDREWTAIMTFLERRQWQDFGRRMMRIEGSGQPVSVTFRRPHMDAGSQSDALDEVTVTIDSQNTTAAGDDD